SFTGSTPVGRSLLAQASKRVLNSSMELGGNAPFIVMPDADLDAAVEGAMIAKMRNGGEACTAANRFLVHESVAQEFTSRLTTAMEALRVGPGLEKDVQMGPLVDEPSRLKVEELIQSALDQGAKVRTGATRPDGAGYFYSPTVLE
ncbi:MAG: aldehyde dehydrogenase family protein, partial [Acidimicrobiales bacterium]